MVRVQMADDIRNIENKISNSVTTKQFKGILAAIIIYFVGLLIIPISNIIVKTVILMPFVLICILSVYITIYKQPFEIFVTRLIVYSFIIPPKRRIIRKNSYREDYKKIKQQRENKKLNKMTAKEKKQYLKNKKNVTYSNKLKYKCYF